MTGVASQLGLVDLDSELLVGARQRWRQWLLEDDRLAPVLELAQLRTWLRHADPGEADDVLHALARLGSPSGGDERAASAVLAWALLPGACALAARLQRLSPRIDEVVAAQLWLEVRSFPWARLRKVAANILANTRAGVMRDCGVTSQVERADRTWGRTRAVDPLSPSWTVVAPEPEGPASAEELDALLTWACDKRVISAQDRTLLLSLVMSADLVTSPLPRRGRSGLMAAEVSAAVAADLGLSAVTVRRRARQVMATLSLACQDGDWAA